MLCRFVLIGLLSSLSLTASELPAYLKEALISFHPEIPPDFAYTLTTRRGSEISVERFDPSRPTEEQWTLLLRNQRPATAEDNSRYRSYRITIAPNARAIFKYGDIDLASLHLIRETESHAVFQGRFRDDLVDPMLHHLEIFLTVAKSPPAIDQYILQLIEPFSPVLTVKMLDLHVETILVAPTDQAPLLPRRTNSHFRGRIMLFKSIEEDVQTSYADFVRVTPIVPPSLPNPP